MKLAVNQLYFFSEKVECSNCGSSILCRRKTSISFICNDCPTIYKISETGTTDIQYKIEDIQKKTKVSNAWKPLLNIGDNIQLKSVDYQIIGAFTKIDSDNFSWNEYYLSDKNDDTYYLTEYNGHWTFLKELKQHNFSNYEKNSDSIDYIGQFFKIYSKYTYHISFAKGEFPVDIIEKHKIKVQEFIAPPYVLTCETEVLKDTWFLGEYILPNEINEGLQSEIELPERSELGSIEVLEDSFPLHEVVKTTFLLLTFLFFFQMIFVWFKSDIVLINEGFNIKSDSTISTPSVPFTTSKPLAVVVTKSFTIKEANSIDFEIEAPVDNSWFEGEVTLINEKTGEENGFSVGVEYYHGVESSESWSEGSYKNDFTISNVQPGKYHLEIQPICDPVKPISFFNIKATWSTKHFTDFFIVLLLLLIYPVYKYFKNENDERTRWSVSDYSPYDED